MKKTAIILGGGSGLRAGGEIPKQFQDINGKPMLWWSIEAFYKEDSSVEIIVVLHPEYFELWNKLTAKIPKDEYISHVIVCGGRSRWHSVYNGLLNIKPEIDSYVAIHDGARPLISTEMIHRGWVAAKCYQAAIPVVPLTDSIRKKNNDTDSITVNRSDYIAVQTPQVFDSTLIKQAYTMPDDPRFTDPDGKFGIPPFTDDASVVESINHHISLYDGNANNIKVTNPIDFAIAEILMNNR